MRPIDRVLDRLDRLGCSPRKCGSGWIALCPYHEQDGQRHSPSLSVSVAQDERVLIRCFAGCGTELILERLGLRWADLWPDGERRGADVHQSARRSVSPAGSPARPARPPARPTANPSPDGPDGNGQTYRGKVYHTAEAALEAIGKGEDGRLWGKPDHIWIYTDKDSNPVMAVGRWDCPPGKTKKELKQVSRCQNGWIPKAAPDPRPLYRLPTLLAADPNTPVIVCEGEKAADAAAKCGLLATTSSGGAQAAGKADWTPLQGRNVIILPDHDEAGETYADTVARLAREAGAASVKIVHLSDYCPDLPTGGDIADLLDDPGWCGAPLLATATPEDLGRLVLQWAEEAPEVELPQPGPVITCLAHVQPEEIQWLWYQRFPLGKISLLVGMPGSGKSLLTIDMAAKLSRGQNWPDGADCPQGDSLFIIGEDGLADTVRPRAEAAYADMRRIHVLEAIRRKTEDGKEMYTIPVCLTHTEEIGQAMAHIRPRLVVLDPVGHFIPVDIDTNVENHVRQVLGRLAELATEFGAAILLVAHRRKARADYADDVVLGSRAFVGLARAVWHVCRDAEDETRRLLVPGKNNLAGPMAGLAFRIVSEHDIPHLEWLPDPVPMTATQAINREYEAIKGGVLEDAQKALVLALSHGPKPEKAVLEELLRQGFSEKTIRRAKRELGIKSVKNGFQGVWEWKLPDGLSEPPENGF